MTGSFAVDGQNLVVTFTGPAELERRRSSRPVVVHQTVVRQPRQRAHRVEGLVAAS